MHKWTHPTLYLTGQSIRCARAYQAPSYALPLKRLSNQVMPWDSIHWYSWVKYFFRVVVTVTGSRQYTSMASAIQRPFSFQWILEFIYSNLFWGELESIESFKWIKFLQQWKNGISVIGQPYSLRNEEMRKTNNRSLISSSHHYLCNVTHCNIIIGNRGASKVEYISVFYLHFITLQEKSTNYF